jgi:hypothetical protein
MTSHRLGRALACALALAGCHAGETNMEKVPIVCRLDALSDDERARSQALRAEISAAVEDTRPLDDGLAVRLRGEAPLLRSVVEWIALERRCCPFLSFELHWKAGGDEPPWLWLTGPEGTKEFLAGLTLDPPVR